MHHLPPEARPDSLQLRGQEEDLSDQSRQEPRVQHELQPGGEGRAAVDIGGEAVGGWRDDDIKLDDEDTVAGSDAKGDGWAAEEDNEIPPDMDTL